MSRDVVVSLTEAQDRWLSETAAEQSPPQSTGEFMRTLLGEAMRTRELEDVRRARQLEIFQASGYTEHHPDYPTFRGGL